MAKYKVTHKAVGWVVTASRQTAKIEEHLNEHAAKGWELIQADRNNWEIPLTRRFVWKLPNDQ